MTETPHSEAEEPPAAEYTFIVPPLNEPLSENFRDSVLQVVNDPVVEGQGQHLQ